MKKELLIFDMDGTLVDSGDVITNTINFVRTNIGLAKIDKNQLLVKLNDPKIDSSKYFYGTSTFTDKQTRLFTKYYNKHCIEDVLLYEGIADMLKELSKYFILAIATNASVEFATKMVRYLNIDKYFKIIVGGRCVKNPKPEPDMVYKILHDLNISNNKAILIGDSLKDKQSATTAKVDFILVNWGFTSHKNIKYVSSVIELTKQLLEFKSN